MRPRYSSNSGIFEKRGDPWSTEREGIRDFNRNPETENAEYDFDHRFHETGNAFGKPAVAPERREYRDPMPERINDAARRKASIARRMNAAIASHSKVTEVLPPTRTFRPCGGCRSAACIRKGICQTLNR